MTRRRILKILQPLLSAPSFKSFSTTAFQISVRAILFPIGARRRDELLNNVLFRSKWEPKVTKHIKKLKGGIFVDLGANRGYYTFIAAPNFREVYAVEPEPGNVLELKQAIRRTRFDNIHVVEAAIADFEGDATLTRGLLPNVCPGNYTIEEEYVFTPSKHKRVRIPTEDVVRVPVHTLTTILPNAPIDTVKVDVEGAEWRILKGAESIMPRIRTWIIELHDLARKGELTHYMAKHGYKCKWLDEHHGVFSQELRV